MDTKKKVVNQIGISWITTQDSEKAKTFFQDTLGLKLVKDIPEMGWMEFEGHNGGIALRIGQSNPQGDEVLKPGQNAIITFEVTNIEGFKEELESKGVTFHGPIMDIPGVCKLALFTDSDNNRFQLVENY